MVSALRRYKVTSADKSIRLRARFYDAASIRPTTKAVPTESNKHGQSPRVDLLFKGGRLQPVIHDVIIGVKNRRRTSQFHIFIKNHKLLPPNKVVDRWRGGHSWRGDIVILRKGLIKDFVNMRTGDGKLADFALKRLLTRVHKKPRLYIPKALVFEYNG